LKGHGLGSVDGALTPTLPLGGRRHYSEIAQAVRTEGGRIGQITRPIQP
jgi:hypothetical protein